MTQGPLPFQIKTEDSGKKPTALAGLLTYLDLMLALADHRQVIIIIIFFIAAAMAWACDAEPPKSLGPDTSSEQGSDSSFDSDTDTDLSFIYPQYRLEPSHVGLSPAGTSLGPDIALKWRTEAFGIGTYSASKSSPAVDEDRIFVGVDDGRLLALSRETGALIWAFESRRFAVEAVSSGSVHYGIHGSPAFDESNVYIGDYSGFLYAVDKRSGGLTWERELGGSIGASVTLHGGLIYISVEFREPDGKVFVVDPESGETVWSTPYLGDHPHSSVSIDESRSLMVVGANNGRLFGFDIDRREELWSYETEGEIKSTAALFGDTAYVTSWDTELHAVSLDDGSKKFTFATNDVTMSSPCVFNNLVYFGSHDTRAYAVDALTGDMSWTFETSGPVLSSPTIIQESDLVAVGSRDHFLYLLDAATGEPVWSCAMPSGVSSVPVAVGNSLFVNDDEGAVSCFEMP